MLRAYESRFPAPKAPTIGNLFARLDGKLTEKLNAMRAQRGASGEAVGIEASRDAYGNFGIDDVVFASETKTRS
jgi:hypothetical protein